jgi:RhtB (resistance to homoserine/threonine) family protein
VSPFSLLLSLFAVDFLVAVTPGPAFVGISQIAVRYGARSAVVATGGLLVSAWVYCIAVLSGLTILFQIAPWAYLVLKFAGGAYLVWIGIQFLRAGKSEETAESTRVEALPPTVAARKGLLIGLTNPKAMVYFGSIFTLFLKPGSPMWLDAAAVGIVTFDVTVWYCFVSLLFSRGPVRRAYQRMGHWIERAAGTVMVGFGLKLVLTK